MSRHVTVRDHDAWRRSMSQQADELEFDEIDLHVAERPPEQRGKREVSRVLRILDQLYREGGTR